MTNASSAPTRSSPRAAGPLVGVTILELGTLIAGPFGTRLLADLGADVIKVEAPDALDPMRRWGHGGDTNGRTLWWAVQSRNKRCVTLDLRKEEGQRLFCELAKHADALVENFRPGTLERWNLGPAELWQANPRLVIVRISGYGQTGPYAGRAGFASVAEAMGGLRHINGFEGEPPPRHHISLGDSLAGMFAAQGTLAALYRRDVGGHDRGQVVDVSLLESCFAVLESTVPEYDRFGIVRGPGGTRLPGNAPSNIYKSRDGRWLVIAANTDRLFARLCDAMGSRELASDGRFATHEARGENQDRLDALIGGWAARRDAHEIETTLNAAGVICGPIYSVADMFADEHFWARGMFVRHDDPELGTFVGPGVTPSFSATPGAVRWTGGEPSSHNEAVFGELLGLSEAERRRLAEEGVI